MVDDLRAFFVLFELHTFDDLHVFYMELKKLTSCEMTRVCSPWA